MNILFWSCIVVFVIVCLGLILLVLVQSDKGGGISGAVGGGIAGANSELGAQETANILTKSTTVCAVAYLVLCIVLSLVLTRLVAEPVDKSLLKNRAEKMGNYTAPATGTNVLPVESSDKKDTTKK